MAIHEIVVISGKGGTGKTTLTASILPFLEKTVVADCDVDAPDLHILLHPVETESHTFIGTKKAKVDSQTCTGCMACYHHCQFNAISESIVFNSMKCEGCGVCELVCPVDAVSLEDTVVGTIYEGDTHYGPMVHARLIPGEETSGKLVSAVRNKAKKIAEEKNFETVLIDGSPGIGCNVISSITGADTVVIVTEPTMSGIHDMKRVLDITEKFSGKAFVVINKCDLSEHMSREIERESENRGTPVVLKLPFNGNMVKSITDKKIPSLAEDVFFSTHGFANFIHMLKE